MTAALLMIAALLTQSLADIYKAATADLEAHRWSDAAQKYEQILKEDSTHVPTMFGLAVSYTNLNEPKRAAEIYSKLLEADGAVYEARVNFAWLLEKMGERAAAEEQMERAVALRPEDPKADMIAASFFTARNQLDRAHTHLLNAEQKGLRTAELYIALSQSETRLNHEAKSREYLDLRIAIWDLLRDEVLKARALEEA